MRSRHAGTPDAISGAIAKSLTSSTGKILRVTRPVRIGFVGLTDCAPLAMARELGLFEKYGLNVQLSREIGWATIREKVLYGELDAAHAPAGILVAAANGLGGLKADCLTGMVLNLHGNAITLSQRLWHAGVREAGTLQAHVRKTGKPLTLGTVHHWSSHSILLRLWLKEHGLEIERDAKVVVVPPSQMVARLRAGDLDGFCVGEPWNSLAVLARAGWVVARSAELAAMHPEKVLMVRGDFARRAHEEHIHLIASLTESARYCEEPANRERIADVLARPDYVGTQAEALRRSMRAVFDYGNGRVEPCPGFNIFARGNANCPDARKASWVVRNLISSGLATPAQLPVRTAVKCFRPDIFARATALTRPTLVPSAA